MHSQDYTRRVRVSLGEATGDAREPQTARMSRRPSRRRSSFLFSLVSRRVVLRRIVFPCVVGLLGFHVVPEADAKLGTGGPSDAAIAPPAKRLRLQPRREIAGGNPDFRPPLERRLTSRDKAANLAPDLIDAILRIEGVFDPTRQGTFGPALRMMIRAGTASMADAFGERWRRADSDPNLHARVRYLAEEWFYPPARDCAGFRRFRPDEFAVGLDMPTPEDCAQLAGQSATHDVDAIAEIVSYPTDLPIFAAPYPGSRFTPKELRAVIEAHLRAIKARAWWSGASH